MKKTIIHVWIQNSRTIVPTEAKSNYCITSWGIGDLLRGTYGLYLLSQKLECDFIVDISLHPVSQLLKHIPHKYSTTIKDNLDSINFILPKDVNKYVEDELKNEDFVYLCTNCLLSVFEDDIDTILHTNFMDIINTILTPTEEFKEYIDQQLSIIPFDTIHIIHYRLGDKEILFDTDCDYNKYQLNNTDNTILISDSKNFKLFISKKFNNIFIFDNEICHLGIEKNKEKIKHTLFEIFLLKHAKTITSYSIYEWKSSYIRIIDKTYNIPCKYNKL